MLSLAFIAAVSLQECKSRDFRVPVGEPASPPPGLKRDKGWEQLTSGRLSVSWDHKKGMLLVTRGHQLLLQGFYKGIKFSDILLVHSQLLW